MCEIELFIFIKMDLALNNLQWLICHKTHQTKPNLTWIILVLVICLHTAKWFPVILFIKYSYVIQIICHQLYGFKLLLIIILSKLLNSSVWPLHGTLTDNTNQDQSEPESNGSEGIPHILQSSRSRASRSEAV